MAIVGLGYYTSYYCYCSSTVDIMKIAIRANGNLHNIHKHLYWFTTTIIAIKSKIEDLDVYISLCVLTRAYCHHHCHTTNHHMPKLEVG